MKQVIVGSENGECVTEKLSEVVSGWLSFFFLLLCEYQRAVWKSKP